MSLGATKDVFEPGAGLLRDGSTTLEARASARPVTDVALVTRLPPGARPRQTGLWRNDREPVAQTTLYLNYDAELDWLMMIEFGHVDDGQPSENWRGVSGSFGYLLRPDDGIERGFKVLDFSQFDAEDPDVV